MNDTLLMVNRRQVQETAAWLEKKLPVIPHTAIMLGSGLGNLTTYFEKPEPVSYIDVPNLPTSTVMGHKGEMVFGYAEDKPVLAFRGRWHFYEGYLMSQVTFYVRVLRELGIRNLVVTNAAGGLGQGFRAGDIMLIQDHINMMGTNPLLGPNDEYFGPRFVSMSNAYDHKLRQLAEETASRLNIPLQKGVYLAVSGPTYETHAEVKMFKILGADAVGMSTIPEVIVANQCGMKVLGFSAITNVINPGDTSPVTHEEVLDAGQRMESRFCTLIMEILKNIPKGE